MLALFLVLIINICSAFHVTTGFYKSLIDVQDKNGKEVTNPFNPTIGVGYNWQFSPTWGFSPQIGYIYDWKKSDDGYNDYKVHTFNILYDFAWLPFDGMTGDNFFAIRMGVGTFIKKIKGEGGSVTVPNGSSTSKAYRPDETSTSYSSTLNFGADMSLNIFKDYFQNFGIRFETYVFRPLSKEYRNYAYSLSAVAYF